LAGYRIFFLKLPSGILSREEFEAATDVAAIAQAQELARANAYASGYELWERTRLVHRESTAVENSG